MRQTHEWRDGARKQLSVKSRARAASTENPLCDGSPLRVHAAEARGNSRKDTKSLLRLSGFLCCGRVMA